MRNGKTNVRMELNTTAGIAKQVMTFAAFTAILLGNSTKRVNSVEPVDASPNAAAGEGPCSNSDYVLSSLEAKLVCLWATSHRPDSPRGKIQVQSMWSWASGWHSLLGMGRPSLCVFCLHQLPWPKPSRVAKLPRGEEVQAQAGSTPTLIFWENNCNSNPVTCIWNRQGKNALHGKASIRSKFAGAVTAAATRLPSRHGKPKHWGTKAPEPPACWPGVIQKIQSLQQVSPLCHAGLSWGSNWWIIRKQVEAWRFRKTWKRNIITSSTNLWFSMYCNPWFYKQGDRVVIHLYTCPSVSVRGISWFIFNHSSDLPNHSQLTFLILSYQFFSFMKELLCIQSIASWSSQVSCHLSVYQSVLKHTVSPHSPLVFSLKISMFHHTIPQNIHNHSYLTTWQLKQLLSNQCFVKQSLMQGFRIPHVTYHSCTTSRVGDHGDYASVSFKVGWQGSSPQMANLLQVAWKSGLDAFPALNSDQSIQIKFRKISVSSSTKWCRPWHADISWPVISACPKFRKNPRSMNLGGRFRNTWLHATVWPQTRTCKESLNFGLLAPISQKYFACHGLTSDQDMQGVHLLFLIFRLVVVREHTFALQYRKQEHLWR